MRVSVNDFDVHYTVATVRLEARGEADAAEASWLLERDDDNEMTVFEFAVPDDTEPYASLVLVLEYSGGVIVEWVIDS